MTAREIIANGYFIAAAVLMDDEIREQIHAEYGPETEYDFLRLYMDLHEQKYGERFEI